jgi:DNA-binding MarR family transcriptional regulator
MLPEGMARHMTMVSRKVRPDVLEFDLGYNCYRLSQLVRDEMLEQLKHLEADVTPEQWHLLLCLAAAPEGLTPSELAQSALRDKTTISRMLDVMERHELIERLRRPKDGRSYIVRLSLKSRQILDRARNEGNLVMADRIFAPLNSAERDYLLALVQKCRRNASDM